MDEKRNPAESGAMSGCPPAMQGDSELLLDIRNLEVKYITDMDTVNAVNLVSLTLRKGETLGLVGETGAGKTTIAKAIMRILPEPPSKICGGEI